MDRRLTLQENLERIPKVKKVYFQPPASIRMVYPCIRFTRGRPRISWADDRAYRFTQGYELMVIDPDPDSQIARYIVENFPMAEINATYVSDNLYHTPITLYY